jgi:hypothetical protein
LLNNVFNLEKIFIFFLCGGDREMNKIENFFKL